MRRARPRSPAALVLAAAALYGLFGNKGRELLERSRVPAALPRDRAHARAQLRPRSGAAGRGHLQRVALPPARAQRARARSGSCSCCRARPRASRRARAARSSCPSDLDDPELNVRYGAWYLRHLQHYRARSMGSPAPTTRAWRTSTPGSRTPRPAPDPRRSRDRAYDGVELARPTTPGMGRARATPGSRTRPRTARSASPQRSRRRAPTWTASSTRERLQAPLPGRARPRREQSDFLDCRRGTLPTQRGLRADGRSAAGDRRAGGRRQRGPAVPDAARRDRHGQDVHDGQRDRGRREADARDRPQQDARRAALQRVPRVLPDERGRVLRLVLRLLPARGVPALVGHVHREGLLAQRGHRPAAPRGDVVAAAPPRRRDRRLGLVHLRPRLAERVRGAARDRAHGRELSRATSCCARSSTSSTAATTWCSGAGASARAATSSRCSPRTPRPPTASRCSATRSSRSRTSTRSAARSTRARTRSRSTRRRTT